MKFSLSEFCPARIDQESHKCIGGVLGIDAGVRGYSDGEPCCECSYGVCSCEVEISNTFGEVACSLRVAVAPRERRRVSGTHISSDVLIRLSDCRVDTSNRSIAQAERAHFVVAVEFLLDWWSREAVV